MVLKKAIATILFLFITSAIIAQEPAYWQLTDKDGLPSMEVYDLYQDKKGYMWIATDKGLCRYDGLSIKRYEHPNQKGNAVSLIKEDEHGQIWFKAFSGQLFYIDKQDSCQLFPIPKEYKSGAYYTYVLKGNELYLATNRLCNYNFETQKWKTDSFPNVSPNLSSYGTYNLQIDHKGNLIYINALNEIWAKEGNVNRKIIDVNGRVSIVSFAEDSILLAKNDSRDAIYIGHVDNLDSSNLVHLTPPQLKQKNKNKFNHPRALNTCHSEGLIWLGTMDGIFAYERTKTGNWKQKYHLLPNEQVSGFEKDKEGNIWLATLHNGIFVFPSLDIEFYNTQNSSLTNEHLICMEKDSEDHLLIGGSDGVVMRFDTENKKLKDRYVGKKSNVISIVFDEKREQVIFSSYGLQVAKWKDSQKVDYLGTLTGGGHENAIYKEDFLLLGRNAFMNFINLRGTFGKDSIPSNELNINYTIGNFIDPSGASPLIYSHMLPNLIKIKGIWVDQQNPDCFWVSANDSLYLYGEGSRQVILDQAGKSFIAIDINQTTDGAIWCATLNKGLYKIVNRKVVKTYTKKDGLPENNCTTLTTDGMVVWLGTEKGIIKLNSENDEIDVYNDLDGCISNEIRDIEVTNGQIWAVTIKGLINFNVHTTSLNSDSPFIELTSLEVNKKAYNLEIKADLLYQENDLKFNFQTTAFRGRDKITYEYRLLGLDSVWIELPFSTNFVHFQGLIPGDFIFEVRAVNEDGIFSKETAKYFFIIRPPYWQTLWFQLLSYSMVIFIVIALGILRYRNYRRKQDMEAAMSRMKMQALQSQMNPHFVFNAMSAIQDYWIEEEPQMALMYHAKFAKLMRLIFAYSNELSIHIEDELEFLKIYVSLEQVRFEGKVEVVFDVEETLLEKEIYLTPLLIQPQLENCFKHGMLHKEGKGNIIVRLKSKGDYVYCAIEDDGVGRKKASKYASWRAHFKKKISSLDITQERLEILNNLFGKYKKKEVLKISDLETEEGQPLGTLVEMWIPKIINE